MGARSQSPDAGVRRRRRYDRASILDGLRLSDGRMAWPVAAALGISEATFRARLKRGLSPDQAIAPPRSAREVGRIGGAEAARRRAVRPWNTRPEGSKWDGLCLPDGRLASDVAAASGVSRTLLHLRLSRGWCVVRAATERPWSAVDAERARKAPGRGGSPGGAARRRSGPPARG